MSFIRKYINISLILIGSFVFLSGLFGCVDEKLIENPSNPDLEEEIDGYSIGFYVQLDKNLTSRADGVGADARLDETYDNWIDTQDKFRIFFFTASGDFLFGAIDRTVTSVKTTDFTHDTWYVRVPVNVIIDRDNKEFDTDKLKDYLKKNPFKIAVLANWPNKGEKINPGDYDDSDGNQNIVLPELKGEPLWGVEESILNPLYYDTEGKFIESYRSKIKNINDLHHIYDDAIYQSKTPVYDFVMKENKYMGEPTDWVKMRDLDQGDGWKNPARKSAEGTFNSQATAAIWIRNNWNPDLKLNGEKNIYRHYQYLWQLWDFNGAFQSSTSNTSFYTNELWGENKWADEWDSRNGKVLRDFLTNVETLSTWNEYDYIDKSNINSANKDLFLYFKNSTGSTKAKKNKKQLNGIQLPAATNLTSSGGKNYVTNNSDYFFRFNAKASGTVRVLCNSQNGDKGTTIVIQRGSSTIETTVDIPGNGGGSYTDMSKIITVEKDLTINGNEQPIYIYCTGSQPAMIYAIEYIESKYLYDTDREGVIPSEKQPIPMYGVQNFEAINQNTTNWEYGSTYNLSVIQEKSISLLRSLAKIEVYIPTAYGELSHVYMRSMNRVARCEPMNVTTPTDELWTEQNLSSPTDNKPHSETDCEWYTIQQYGPGYDSSDKTQDNYIKYLSWFYGDWKNLNEWPWLQTTDGTTFKKYSSNSSLTSPKIFNPYINRSDYCRFIYAGTSGDYNKYVLYMPEKNIDDPNTVGDKSSTPEGCAYRISVQRRHR